MSKENVFLASLKERKCLNFGSERETYHLVIDLNGSGIDYQVGDCLGIYPQNDPLVVEKLLKTLHATGDELIEDRDGNFHRLYAFLLNETNLLRLPKNEHSSLTAFCKELTPQLPRFYSIASSQQAVGNEAHLTVGLIDGVCSHYLCKRAALHVPSLAIFHQPSRHFSLPPESYDKPIIMIGPGTGIAPFLGFMQERIAKKALEKNWLFFGERHQKTDFYYQSYWEELMRAKKLKLDSAFSRDQEEKIYVTHKLLEKSAQVWEWLKEGAYLFVCGNASKMAKDVDKVLHTIVEKEGSYSPTDAKNFIKELKKSKRYQRDVY